MRYGIHLSWCVVVFIINLRSEQGGAIDLPFTLLDELLDDL